MRSGCKPFLTRRFDLALQFASGLHHSQCWKGTPIPYISHLMASRRLSLKPAATRIWPLNLLEQSEVVHFAGGRRFGETHRSRFHALIGLLQNRCCGRGNPKAGVGGSTPSLATIIPKNLAESRLAFPVRSQSAIFRRDPVRFLATMWRRT